jgi:hypothetical protein
MAGFRERVASWLREAGAAASPSRPRRWLGWMVRLALAAAVALALWSALEGAHEPRSLSLRFALPGWFALLLALYGGLYVANRWLRAWRPEWIRLRPSAAEPNVATTKSTTQGVSTPGPTIEEPAAPERLLVRSGRTTHLLEVDRIRWIGAEGKYTRLWLPERNYLSQYSITEIEARLYGQGFFRIHRSRIVNLGAVRALRTRGARDAEAVLDDGTTLPIARSHRAELERRIGMRRDVENSVEISSARAGVTPPSGQT